MKQNWASIAIVIAFIAATIYMRDVIIGVITLVTAIALAFSYVRFDEDEQIHNEWWNRISKEEKKEVYKKDEKIE